jgi:hypothetical protein
MKRSARLIPLFLLLAAVPAWAQSAGGFKPKTRSSFTSVDGLRNPFWPIGFAPGAPTPSPEKDQVVTPPPQQAPLKPEDFNLTSITSFQGVRMAMISGKAVGEGDITTVHLGEHRTKVQILRITDGAVVLRCMGQEVTVTLKRPELDLMSRPAPAAPVIHSQEE